MAESTLAITKSDLDKIIGFQLGYGRTTNSFVSADWQAVNEVRNAGIQKFYSERDWVFLSPTTTITTTADDDEQDLPDDFGQIRSDFFFAADKGYAPPTQTSPGRIRELLSISDSSGIPRYYAINPKSQDGSSGTRWEVLWYPPPDDAYVMTYRYNVLRDALTTSYPYPAGGSLHRETIIAACIAQSSYYMEDGSLAEKEAIYDKALAKSIRSNALLGPKNLGKNNDRSDNSIDDVQPVRYAYYNGSLPT